jgi:cytochrome P450
MSRSAGVTEPESLLVEILLGDHGTAGPYDAYRRLRESAPVLRSRSGVLVLSRYADCDAALRDRCLGKVDESLGFRLTDVPEELSRSAMKRFRRTMLFRNPPDHARLRRLVTDVFTHRHVDGLRDSVVRWTDTLLDAASSQGEIDAIASLALPLPVHVISDLVGVPLADREQAAPLVRALVAPLEPTADAEAVRRAADAENQLAEYFSHLLASKRSDPQDDLLSRISQAQGDDTLDDEEAVGTAILLFAAGFETTSNLIGNGLTALLTHPAQLHRLRTDPDLAPNAVEELLRYDTPVQTDGRTALAPTSIAGVDIAEGEIVLTLLGAANRDPARFADPETLDVTRPSPSPLSFGAGIHFCLGAALARAEGVEVFPRLLTRFPRIELAGQPQWRSGLTFRGLTSLPVRLR